MDEYVEMIDSIIVKALRFTEHRGWGGLVWGRGSGLKEGRAGVFHGVGREGRMRRDVIYSPSRLDSLIDLGGLGGRSLDPLSLL